MAASRVLAPNPFYNRQKEWKLFEPLVGESILELGDKENEGITYKSHFEYFGFRHVSVDTNGKHGSLAMDLREPLNLGQFDMVSNIGTSEHVSPDDFEGQAQCWRNMLDAMHVDSVLVAITPAPGAWPWHGYWYPERGFYLELASLNGLDIERLYESMPTGPRALQGKPVPPNMMRSINARLVRRHERPFQMPKRSLMYLNTPPRAKGYER